MAAQSQAHFDLDISPIRSAAPFDRALSADSRRVASSHAVAVDINARHFFAAPWLLIALCLIFALTMPALALASGPYIMLASGLLMGMPHGACDLWALRHLRDRSGHAGRHLNKWELARVVGLYLAIAFATFGVWAWNSGAALAGFIAITVWHFGNGDAWIWADKRGARSLLSLGRGLIVMCAPLALRSTQTHELLGRFAALSSDAASIEWLWTIAPSLLGLGLLLQLAGQIAQGKAACAPWFCLWLESAILLALFAFVPPLLAVSCYFMGVHALRHLLRLEAHSAPDRTSNPRLPLLWRAAWKHHRHSLFLSVITFIGTIPIVLLWPQLSQNAVQMSVGYLVLVSAVTSPHAALIFWMEWRERI